MIAVAIGVAVLLGWILGVQAMTRITPDFLSAKANSAVGFILLGCALLLLLRRPGDRLLGGVAVAFAVIGLVYGLLTFLEAVAHVDLHIDQLLVKEAAGSAWTASPGRPPATASLCFVLVSMGLLALRTRRAVMTQCLAAGAGVIVVASLLTFALGASKSRAFGDYYTTIPLLGAASLLSLSIGLLLARPREGPMAVVMSGGAGGRAVRRLAPLMLVIPLAVDALIEVARHRKAFTEEYERVLEVTMIIALSIVVVWLVARWLDRDDAALRASESRLRAVIDNMQDAYVRTDAAGRLVAVSPSTARLYGYDSSAKMIGMPVAALYADVADREDVLDEVRAEGRVSDRIGEARRKDGSSFWISLNAQAWSDADGTVRGHEGFMRDISERRAIEQALADSEARHRELVSHLGSGVVVYEATGGGPDFVIKDFNLAAARIEGVDGDAVIGRLLTDAFPGVKEFGLLEVLRRVSTTGSAESFPAKLYEDDHLAGWRENYVYRLPFGEVVAVYDDVTERQRARKALIESEDRFRHVFASSLVGLSMTRTDGGVTVNEAFREMLGYSAEELAGRTWQSLTHPDDVADTEKVLAGILAGETKSARVEKRYVHKDGSIVWADVATTLRRDANGEPIHFITSVLDISERKRAEEALLAAEEALRRERDELERSNSELEQFAYVASHDLQEPLRMVGMYTQLLARRYEGRLDSDADEFIGFAVDGAQRMQAMITGLLEFSRVATRGSTFVPTDSRAAFDEAVMNLGQATADAGAQVTADGLPTVSGDHQQLVRLFQNLIGNAIKFHGHEPPRVHVSAEHQDDGWVFAVRDNGIGLEPRYADRIFLIFQRLHAKEDYPGTGIGLALCQRIVARHGGRIWAQSALGEGATFFFTIPDADGEP